MAFVLTTRHGTLKYLTVSWLPSSRDSSSRHIRTMAADYESVSDLTASIHVMLKPDYVDSEPCCAQGVGALTGGNTMVT